MAGGPEPTPGLLLVDKAGGMTSHDVVARVRRLAGTRKVGHAGTLDPMATGVLVLGVGRATRLLGHLTLTEKTYDATLRLGAATLTDDVEGETTTTATPADLAALTDRAVRTALADFLGELQQVPTAVSAVKVDGRRSYARVRAGEDVDLPARTVTVHDLVVHDVRGAGSGEPVDVDLTLRCSSGTYVRAVARDLGAVLGVGGHLTALRRTRVGPFAIERAATLDEHADSFGLVPVHQAARAAFPAVDLDAAAATDVGFGRALDLPLEALSAVFAPDGAFLALYEPDAARPGRARPRAVFV